MDHGKADVNQKLVSASRRTGETACMVELHLAKQYHQQSEFFLYMATRGKRCSHWGMLALRW